MILIADSGSTKCHWVAISGGEVIKQMTSAGINPFFQSAGEIAREIAEKVTLHIPVPTKIFFYGAGCTAEKAPQMERTLAQCFPQAFKIEVNSDMIAAARALFGSNEGISCILGTGSNSCQWNGQNIVCQVPPCGFILGDEGSGAVIGKTFITSVIRGELPEKICQDFLNEYRLSTADIIENVYRKPYPNRFLASTVHFIYKNSNIPELRNIVIKNFAEFFTNCVNRYDKNLILSAIGSTAFYFENIFRDCAVISGFKIGTIVQSPMAGLIRYHGL